jgi:2-polyprenyl-3-methyl-5-hydroxy-6-metoxy-1,4-benzoquinol methylase
MVSAEDRRDELVGRLFGATVGALDLLSVYVGDRLGLYWVLAEKGPLTSRGLAVAAGVEERYAREWLEQQAATGILEVADQSVGSLERSYLLPVGHDEVLVDERSLSYAAPLGQAFVGAVRPIDALLEAFRTGAGVPYADYGEDLHEGQARITRPMFEQLLGSEWFPACPEIDQRLKADPPARVADVACGCGWSSISIARAYPTVRVDGIDLDEASIEKAWANLAGCGVEDRVAFIHRDAADPALAGHYDLVLIFEALHDMARPVDVLRSLRALLAAGGSVIVGDERTQDTFIAPASDYERFLYGFSVLHCLPVGMVGDDPAGTGTVIRPDTVQRYATQAGFEGFEILPIENDSYRFYRLHS